MDVPPPIPPRPPGYELRTPAIQNLGPAPIPQTPPSGSYYGNAYSGPPPTQPPRPIPQAPPAGSYQGSSYNGPPPTQPPRPQAPPGQPTQWSALHYPDGAHTPLFEQYIAAVFQHLDPQRTGYIRPEVLSNYLDLNAFQLEDNLWKSNLKGNVMFAPEDIADAELKAACEAWPFDHKVSLEQPSLPQNAPRKLSDMISEFASQHNEVYMCLSRTTLTPSTLTPSQVVVRSPGRRPLPFGGMPLLSLRGLIDMMSVEDAAEPERAHRGINATLSRFQIWPHLGPLPRSCLLKDMPAQVQRRVDEVRVRSARAAQEKLQANQARLALEAQGRQNALDLLDPPYVRRYYY